MDNVTARLPVFPIDGTPVHLLDHDEAVALIVGAAAMPGHRALAVASINLDHIHHFGRSRRKARGAAPYRPAAAVDWLNLIDGAPVARHVRRRRKRSFPRLAGSDLIGPILDDACARGLSLGVVGGREDVREPFHASLGAEWPGVRFSGHWTPSRSDLDDADYCSALAAEIAHARIDILLVCLGKPRQERWIDTYGPASEARVLLAFGAVVDFVAGRVSRAPNWITRAGLEWAWRLALEPRRLARRYLVQGPPSYIALRRSA